VNAPRVGSGSLFNGNLRHKCRSRKKLIKLRQDIGSDFGKVLHMDAIDGMRVFIRALLGFGIKPEEVKVMLKDNPAKLMWLD
jgi:hypothetical protein